jgi:hypothetical protein
MAIDTALTASGCVRFIYCAAPFSAARLTF